MVENIHELTARSGSWQETTKLVEKLNRTLRGWANYFSEVSTDLKSVLGDRSNYTAVRLRRWLRFKHKVRRRKGGPDLRSLTLWCTSGSHAMSGL